MLVRLRPALGESVRLALVLSVWRPTFFLCRGSSPFLTVLDPDLLFCIHAYSNSSPRYGDL
jgi:hypothetical protein